jgi:hypothetical protein
MVRPIGPFTPDLRPPTGRSGFREIERYRQKRYEILTGNPGIDRSLLWPKAEIQTTDYTILTSDFFILADATAAAITMTLPATTTSGPYWIKKIDSSLNHVTVATPGSETIDGAASFDLEHEDESITVTTDGANWFII